MNPPSRAFWIFFFNDTATTEIYTLSLHDALPISRHGRARRRLSCEGLEMATKKPRSEEHTSELQSRPHLVCRLLLEKKTKVCASNTNATMPQCRPTGTITANTTGPPPPSAFVTHD